MNPRQWDAISRINQSIPDSLKKGIVEKKVDTTLHDIASNASKDKHISKEGRQQLERMVYDGALIKHDKVTDHKKTAEIDRFISQRMESEMRSGRLKPMAQDAFVRRMQEKTRK